MQHDALADRFITAVAGGDIDTLRTLYTSDALIWHNGPGEGGGAEQAVEDNVRTLRWLSANLQGMRYEEVRRAPWSAGYVQQHVLRGNLPDGAALEIAAALFVTVTADGRIARIEEYADTRGSDALRALSAAQRAARAR
ncbi:SnoaL-like protein [Actinocorallia herbida]|uniref:SnoaL-like protein n=1 Tax=Actinocorallia herbida TaxID=58109 RepID=A0A3N1DBF5_9ACTN|nr:nuclear transport factor 2 family protein [Actinocorallia herbida]ROO90852.1 SnoaL-like protein [Actinocorallia herbida]